MTSGQFAGWKIVLIGRDMRRDDFDVFKQVMVHTSAKKLHYFHEIAIGTCKRKGCSSSNNNLFQLQDLLYNI
jgi:hypothetical protein